METLQAIRERKSYRGTFKPEPISREALTEIVTAGYMAPSGCNMQSTQFIAVDEPELVKKLADIYGIAWAATAPAAIVLLTKFTMTPSGVSYHIHDYCAATENILLAVEAGGYATTWLEGQIRGEKALQMAELLGVPEDLQIVVYLPIGIPAGTVQSAPKIAFEERVSFNAYGK